MRITLLFRYHWPNMEKQKMNSVFIKTQFIQALHFLSWILQKIQPFLASKLKACTLKCIHFWLPELTLVKVWPQPARLRNNRAPDRLCAPDPDPVNGGPVVHLRRSTHHSRWLTSPCRNLFLSLLTARLRPWSDTTECLLSSLYLPPPPPPAFTIKQIHLLSPVYANGILKRIS